MTTLITCMQILQKATEARTAQYSQQTNRKALTDWPSLADWHTDWLTVTDWLTDWMNEWINKNQALSLNNLQAEQKKQRKHEKSSLYITCVHMHVYVWMKLISR